MSILPEKYNKYLQFFIFLVKYRNTQILKSQGSEVKDDSTKGWNRSAQEFVADLKKMGPAFIKFGQFLSTRPDILPANYIEELSNLQENEEPVPFSDIQKVFEDSLGETIDATFSSFNRQPIATASIGQVHEATLHSGQKVAVKIQKPNVEKQITDDLQLLLTLSQKAEEHFKLARDFSVHSVVEELQYLLLQELDYRREAQNLVTLKSNLKGFKRLIVPGIFPDHCSSRVLTMEFIAGKNVMQLSQQELNELPKKDLVDDLLKAYLKQILIDGFAHADPHPGNLHITEDHQLALLDLGMIVRFNRALQNKIQKLILAFSDNDAKSITDIILQMSSYNHETTDVDLLNKKIARVIQVAQSNDIKNLSIGGNIMEICKIAATQNIRLPTEFSALGKIMLNMDQIIVFLTPNYEWQPVIRNYMKRLMRKRIEKEVRSTHLLNALLESKELAENLPHRLNKITEDLADHKFKIEVNALNEHRFLMAFQKVANRISVSVVIAALTIGAAMLMKIPHRWMLFGYPGLAIVLFMIAVLCGLYLVYEILFRDKNERF